MRRAACAGLAALAVLVSACGDTETIRRGGKVNGDTLAVYAVLPLSGPDARSSRDMVEGAKLALLQAGGRAGSYDVTFSAVDELRDGPAEAARLAISDTQLIAALGAGTSTAGRRMVPLFDAAGIALVSPGATEPGLVSDARFHPSGERTFGRLVADDTEQVRRMIEAAAGDAAGPPRVGVEHDGSDTGRRLAAEALRQIDAAGGTPTESRRATLLYFGEDVATAAEVLGASIADGTFRAAVAGEPLARRGLAARLTGEARRRVRLLHAAPAPDETPEAFRSAFREAYGREPGRYAILGHRGMDVLLAAIDRAGARANRRAAVARAVLAELSR